MTRRIINAIVLVVLGALTGTIGTVAHQAALGIGSARIPTGLVLALVAVALLVVGARLVTQDRWAAVWLAVGVVGMIAVFSKRSPGGSVLIPNDLAGQIWVFGPAVISAIAIAWPRVTRRRGAAGAAGPSA